MKKLIFGSAIALFGLSNAQIKTGTVYVSGQISYSKEENKNATSIIKDFKINPTAGLFVAKNLAVGTGLGITNKKEEYNEIYRSGSSATFVNYTGERKAVVVAPFVRKYWTLSNNLYIFGQLEIPMEFGKLNEDALATYVDEVSGYFGQQTLSAERKYTSIGVNVKPGFDYFINKNWSIEATIGEFGYKNFKYKDEGAKALNSYSFGLNLSSITFGVKYVFTK
ncbi:porin family protein [Chryseobacterium sp. RG1]|uniref:Porin family protein n=1 Tax=Chryseobacterium tagetis TaxID=2801334 RepID=A0ABS7ZWN7_9FLAO|nr:outer membrane beta-barrel protein [Chryseobacterium tagetis]MCA6066142.1 porin family protein [Chryseobacterium tagetis]